MRSMVLASGNKGKLREIQEIFGGRYAKLKTPAQLGLELEVVEDGETFCENAVKKAVAYRQATGMDALADDSGICVDALNGAPGVYSARFSGGGDEANNALLLERLKGVPMEKRTARYVACVALAFADGRVITAEAASEGIIMTEPSGTGGFGYDPLFYDARFKRTYAELTPEEKNSISHRGKALRLLYEKLVEQDV